MDDIINLVLNKTKTTTNRITRIGMSALFFVTMLSGLLSPPQAKAYRDIVFPVLGKSSFVNDYYAPRGNRRHYATDIIAKKGQKLVAAVSGTIVDVQYPQPAWGYSVTIEDDEGYQYTYIHMNDDTPGTDDGRGGAMRAYAADMKEGNVVRQGQLLGWVGDSGYSNNIPHLHFEILSPSGKPSNPYQSLVRAKRISKPTIPGRVTSEELPFGTSFNGKANVAMGNFDVDPASEFVVSAGQGGGPHVKIYQDNGDVSAGFFAYGKNFKGGVDVATGDIDGDGLDEIITATGPGSSRIKAFELDGSVILDFFAYGSGTTQGLKVSAGNVDADVEDEIIVGVNAGGEPRVKVFDVSGGSATIAHSFLAYKSTFRGGVDVASGNVVTTSTFDEIVTSAGPTGSPQIRVLQANGLPLNDFRAYGSGMKGGVRVSVGSIRTGTLAEEIVTVPTSSGPPEVKMFSGDGTVLDTEMFIERWWIGGYDVAAGFNTSKAITGANRRVSVRNAVN